MMDALTALAEAAGVSPQWQDFRGTTRTVSPDTLRAILRALGWPADSPAELQDSLARATAPAPVLPPLLTATLGQPVAVPRDGRWQLTLEDATTTEGVAEGGLLPPVHQPGYHRLELDGQSLVLAVAPQCGFTVQDAAPGARPWALAVQLYSLRRQGDGGLGDFRALEDLVGPAAAHGAAGLAISPVHAQFSADPDRFSPYSPSSRIQLNVLHAGIDLPPPAASLEADPLVDWPTAARLRLAALRAQFEALSPDELRLLEQFRAIEGSALETHAVFEALHAHQFGTDPNRWHWRTWPAALQRPDTPEVRAFAAHHAETVRLHAWMQFVAHNSLGRVQTAARAAGMTIGLIADLAVGADSGGSHCWSRQDETLPGLTIGAPPDLLALKGQGWGLSAFSPSGLRRHGYRAFLEMLRHAMRHAGGVRIDHALGLQRLWVIPDGADPSEGAYLAFPRTDLLRLIALESARHRAIVLAEDLGTIPEGFQDRLAEIGALGMRVLWFEQRHGLFTDPRHWTPRAAAVTGTHDLPTVAGWWAGNDLAWRRRVGHGGTPADEAAAEAQRETERAALWAAFRFSGAADGEAPDRTEAKAVADAAAAHIGTAACALVILPIEDALALTEQPNLPGTRDEHPNWRRRLDGPAANLLSTPDVAGRLAVLDRRRRSDIDTGHSGVADIF